MGNPFAAAGLAAALLGLVAAPPAAAADTFTDGQKSAIETIVRDYLVANPEVLEEAFTALQAKRQAAEAENRSKALAQHRELLVNSDKQAVLGNPAGDVTVVEFFDYNCGYCRRAMDDILALIEKDDNVRVVLKEFPVLGESSVAAAGVSIALHKLRPDLFETFHRKLMTAGRPADGAFAKEIAVALGVPLASLEAAMKSPLPQATVEEVYTLANALGLTGTPSFVVGDEVVFGAVGADVLAAHVNEARCGAPSC